MESPDLLQPGARVVITDDADALALTLADVPGADLVDGADAARRAVERRLASLPNPAPEVNALRRLLGHDDPARADADHNLVAGTDAVLAAAQRVEDAHERLAQATADLGSDRPLVADVAERQAVLPPPGEIERLVAARLSAVARAAFAKARLDDAAEPPLPAAHLVSLSGVHPAVVREVAAATIAARARLNDATTNIGDEDWRRDLDAVTSARDIVATAVAARRAAGRSQSQLVGAVAAAAGMLLVIHAGRVTLTADGAPIYLAAAATRYWWRRRRAARIATDAARTQLAALDWPDTDALGEHDARLSAATKTSAIAAAARTTYAEQLARWQDLAGPAAPDDADAIIGAAAAAGASLAQRPLRAIWREEAAAEVNQADADAGRIERALANWAARLDIPWTTPDALCAAVVERERSAEIARRSLRWHAARRDADTADAALGQFGFDDPALARNAVVRATERIEWRTRLDALEHAPLANPGLAAPLVLHNAGAATALFIVLAHVRAPLAVVYPTDDPTVAAAARAAGIAVIDARSLLAA